MDQISTLSAALDGRYRIEREIGRGGMATVYRAHDLRHERPVAIKVLDPELGAVLGASRFLGEIRVTAALQHPNLLPLFDSGEAGGLLYYVMPFIEGETLRARLEREKQLPVDEAVRLSVAILNALEYAHGHGVIHRDLKPENILLQAGQPIVADFGIALAVSRAGGTRVTQTGLSLGTPMYMSPEQAAGDRVIDGRTDVYSLGAMLYEMLAGETPYTGGTTQAIMAKLMTEVPRPVTVLRPSVPEHVEAALVRALEKLPADRFATAAEFAHALVTRTSSGATAVRRAGAAPAARGPRWLVPALAATALAGVAFGAWSWSRPVPAATVTRWALAVADSLGPAAVSAPVISPDGSMIAWVAEGALGPRLVVKRRDLEEPTPIGESSIAGLARGGVTFSPDGRQLAYVAAGTLYRLPLDGGAAVALADTVLGQGIAWVPGDSIVFLRNGASEFRIVSVNGGRSRAVLRSDTSLVFGIQHVRGTRRVLYRECLGAECARGLLLHALDVDDGTTRRLGTAVERAWMPRPDLLFTLRENGVLYATRIDPSTMEPRGEAVQVLDEVQLVNTSPTLDIGPEGTLLYRRGKSVTQRSRNRLVFVDRAGVETEIDTTFEFRHARSGANAGWAVSPDGRRVAIGMNTESGDDIWLKELPRGPLTRLTFDTLDEVRPRWSRDGRWVGYTGMRVQQAGLLRRAADGSGAAQLIKKLQFNGIFEHTIVGETLLVMRGGGTVNSVGGRDISTMRLGDTVVRPLIASRTADERAFQLSPDERWIVYESDETGTTEVYIRPFPNVDAGKWQLSVGGGRAPLWSRDGREIFYVDRGRTMQVAAVAPTASSPGIGERRPLFRMRDDWYLQERENYTPFDIMPDGRHFVMARRIQRESAALGPLVVVEHFLDEVLRKLPAK